jgi:hypothetical protein
VRRPRCGPGNRGRRRRPRCSTDAGSTAQDRKEIGAPDPSNAWLPFTNPCWPDLRGFRLSSCRRHKDWLVKTFGRSGAVAPTLFLKHGSRQYRKCAHARSRRSIKSSWPTWIGNTPQCGGDFHQTRFVRHVEGTRARRPHVTGQQIVSRLELVRLGRYNDDLVGDPTSRGCAATNLSSRRFMACHLLLARSGVSEFSGCPSPNRSRRRSRWRCRRGPPIIRLLSDIFRCLALFGVRDGATAAGKSPSRLWKSRIPICSESQSTHFALLSRGYTCCGAAA